MQQYIGIGRRKTSVARVFLRKGAGKIVINKNRTIESILHKQELILEALKPLSTVEQKNDWDVIIRVSGGGISGWASAISLGIARALLNFDASLRQKLRSDSLLTRDSRIVERKKYGKAGARKNTQFSKR